MKDRERMVISAYRDGEVEAPWKDPVQRKIASDPDWSTENARQEAVRALLVSSPEPNFDEAKARVKARLAGHKPSLPVRAFPLAWVSVAAAALLVFAAGGGYWFGRASVAAVASEVAELQVKVPKQLELKLSGEGQLLMASTLEGIHR